MTCDSKRPGACVFGEHGSRKTGLMPRTQASGALAPHVTSRACPLPTHLQWKRRRGAPRPGALGLCDVHDQTQWGKRAPPHLHDVRHPTACLKSNGPARPALYFKCRGIDFCFYLFYLYACGHAPAFEAWPLILGSWRSFSLVLTTPRRPPSHTQRTHAFYRKGLHTLRQCRTAAVLPSRR